MAESKGVKGELQPPADFLATRIALFDKLYEEQQRELASKPRSPITITLIDGKEVEGKAWETTPYEVAAGISKGLADNAIVARVNGVLWDLDRPFEENATLELLKVRH